MAVMPSQTYQILLNVLWNGSVFKGQVRLSDSTRYGIPSLCKVAELCKQPRLWPVAIETSSEVCSVEWSQY